MLAVERCLFKIVSVGRKRVVGSNAELVCKDKSRITDRTDDDSMVG